MRALHGRLCAALEVSVEMESWLNLTSSVCCPGLSDLRLSPAFFFHLFVPDLWGPSEEGRGGFFSMVAPPNTTRLGGCGPAGTEKSVLHDGVTQCPDSWEPGRQLSRGTHSACFSGPLGVCCCPCGGAQGAGQDG